MIEFGKRTINLVLFSLFSIRFQI